VYKAAPSLGKPMSAISNLEGIKASDNGKSQRLRKEGNARIHQGLVMRPGLAKIIEKVCISTYYESAETDLHIAENACSLDYTDTWTAKRVD
jgi:hypothetical protein